MDKNILTFILLLGLLLLASIGIKESFVDGSGGFVTVSLADLFSIFGAGSTPETKTSQTLIDTRETLKETEEKIEAEFDKQFGLLKDELKKDVREAVRSQLSSQADAQGNVLTDSCIDSVAEQQGTDWMRYIPGKNPADYIRKDSIPCYSCNL